MKRFCLFFLLPIFFLCSCDKNKTIQFEKEELLCVFAVEEETNALKEVYIPYSLTNEEDLFYLYTIYQNSLPLGYSSPANPNITLVSYETKNHIVFYTVDNFILLSDIVSFRDALLSTGKQLELQDVHIIFNQKQLI